MGKANGSIDAHSSDAELLALLRSGVTEAYTELWRRHVQAALRVGRRVAPGQAEDLVSESFLAVYHQIADKGNGPESAFRAYLFTTMRNTALRWQKAGQLVATDPDLDEIVYEDGLSWIEDRAESAALLAAFEDIPERWQRVLWLSEVEEVGRGDIAADLGIKPNAVSALLKRARTGLRLSWLTRQVPESLRDDPAHVARLLPPLILRGRLGDLEPRQQEHLRQCRQCAEVETDLRTSHRQMRHGTLGAAGFAALGIALPAAGPAAPAVAAAGLSLLSLTAIAASVALVIATGAVTTGLFFAPADSSETGTTGSGISQDDRAGRADDGKSREDADSDPDPESTANEATAPAPSMLGRGNTDPTVPVLDFQSFETLGIAPPPPAPTPLPRGSVPEAPPPATPVQEPLPSEQPTQGYFAPMLTGVAPANTAVVVRLHDDTGGSTDYAADVLPDGAWSFDPRGLELPAGTYGYGVLHIADGAASPAESGSFTILAPGIAGLAHPEGQTLEEAATTGTVIELTGEPNGIMLVIADVNGEPQYAAVQLDEQGRSLQRLRLFRAGTYMLIFANYADPYVGPHLAYVTVVTATAGGPTTWSAAPSDDSFELTAP